MLIGMITPCPRCGSLNTRFNRDPKLKKAPNKLFSLMELIYEFECLDCGYKKKLR